MIVEDKVIVMDIDGTICEKKNNKNYEDLKPKSAVLKKLIELKDKGYYIILYTSRQMRTYQGNIGKINSNTGKVLFDWLDKNSIPYDEIHFGKPWCGHNGFYVDDRAIRPREFRELTINEITKILEKDL
jgi:capsule biosynthesis phosphatase